MESDLMFNWLKALLQPFAAPRARRRRTAGGVIESLESRQLLSAVEFLDGDIIMTRNYLPAGKDEVDSGFLVYRPSTRETFTLVVPRLDYVTTFNDPENYNSQIYILSFQFVWIPDLGVPRPHILFAGGIVPEFGDSSVGGVYDFDIQANRLTSILSFPTIGGDPSIDDFTLDLDGTVIVSEYEFRSSDFVHRSKVYSLGTGQNFFSQLIELVEFGLLGTDNFSPTSAMAVNQAGTLFAAFNANDGFFSSNDAAITGNDDHPPGIYRLDSATSPSRELIFSEPTGAIDFQFASDGSIVALIRDVGDAKYSKRDFASERVIRIDPETREVKTLFKGNKRYDYDGLQLDRSGNILLCATDNKKDGNTNLFQLSGAVPNSRKKAKNKPRLVFQDDPGGKAAYGVITSGSISVVKPYQAVTGDLATAEDAKGRVKKKAHGCRTDSARIR